MQKIKSDDTIQLISIDVGRNSIKGYTEFLGESYQYKFLSIISDARPLNNLDNYKEPIWIETNEGQFFCGELAYKEGYQVVRNSSDSKTSLTVKVLIQAMILKLTKCDNIKIMINVPNNQFKKSVLLDIISTYKDKILRIKDKINNMSKIVNIIDCDIAREGDACAFSVMGDKLNERDSVFITIGYKTSEVTFMNKGMLYNDKYSRSIPFGVNTMLLNVQNELKNRGVTIETFEIDLNDEDYNELKKVAFDFANEIFIQHIEGLMPSRLSELDIYVSGGGSLNLNRLDDRFMRVENPLFSVAKGLYYIGKIILM